MNTKNEYGTPESVVLKYLIDGGHNPIGISVMACEETFIFQTKKESSAAYNFINMPESPWVNEGWFYAIDDNGEWPWEKARKDYVDSCYKGSEHNAPKVYWLKK